MTKKYDYIVAGAGAAGLSLIIHLIESGKFKDKKILLVDRVQKNLNDRTWCFWESSHGIFESIVYKRWQKLWFYSNWYSSLNNIGPYTYKLIRGIDFYNYCFKIIREQVNIDIQYGEVQSCFSDKHETGIVLNGENIFADYVFNSIQFEQPKAEKRYQYLLQHFKGSFIQTEEKIFNPSEATLMDFRVDQQHGTTFVYVMPFSSTEALVEYTIFSPAVLGQDEYDKGIKEYCNNHLKLSRYNILSEEFGVIPMTDHPFRSAQHHIINIGTAGGQTKASSGYTFQFIQKNSAAIAGALITTGAPFFKTSVLSKRHAWFDSVLLNILAKNKMSGEKIFSLFMKRNTLNEVLKFLDNETSMMEELKIISPLPKLIFSKAALQTFFR
ncbi:MAG: lycopene cyclase family protein [Flavitalea sp.]